MKRFFNQYRMGFSLYGLIAFIIQELPYIPFLLWPPVNHPLGNNPASVPFLGALEYFGGISTVALLIAVVQKGTVKPAFKNRYFILAAVCLIIYYISWVFYFGGVTNGWLLVIGLSATVPIYYMSVSIWLNNRLALITGLIFFIGHTASNAANFLL